jgi:hypothetical protein
MRRSWGRGMMMRRLRLMLWGLGGRGSVGFGFFGFCFVYDGLGVYTTEA